MTWLRHRLPLLLAATFALAPPSGAQSIVDGSGGGLPNEHVKSALSVVSAGLFDPGAAQFFAVGQPFEDVYGIVSPQADGKLLRDQTICGFYNAKNLHGAYVGLQRFGYDWKNRNLVLYRSAEAYGNLPAELYKVRFGEHDNEASAEKQLSDACRAYN